MNYNESRAIEADLLKNLADRGLERIDQICLLRMALLTLGDPIKSKPAEQRGYSVRWPWR